MNPETVKGELSRLPMYVIRLVVMNPDFFSSIMESTLFLRIISRWLWHAYDTRTWIWLANEGWRNRRLTVQFESTCELQSLISTFPSRRTTGAATTPILRAISIWDRRQDMFSSTELSAYYRGKIKPLNTKTDESRGSTAFPLAIAVRTSFSITQHAKLNSLCVMRQTESNDRMIPFG